MSKNNTLTAMQLKAIMHGKGNALVSASAGSGKTFVVIERIIRLILEENVKVDEILAVTFTKLAAQEMKDKLLSALTKKYLSVKDINLKNQLDLIPSADICTIHSFCSKLIKEYFYVLGIDANYQVVDESKKKRLEENALDELFDELYESKDEDFLRLVSIYSINRSDNGLKKTVKTLSEYCEAEGGIEGVCEKSVETYKNIYSILSEEFKRELKPIAKEQAEIFSLLKDGFEDDLNRSLYCQKIIDFSSELLNAEDYYAFFSRNQLFPSLPSGKSKNAQLQKQLKSAIENYKSYIKDAKEIFSVCKDIEDKNVENSLEILKLLFNLTLKYKSKYQQIKREENALDFGDLEYYALELLSNGEILSRIKNKYKYVFVDEYQDVNGVQERLINALSNDNAFLVGDSKQSIYAFRGCNPTYFEKKHQDYIGGGGTAISLDYNFRSAKSIIDTVNEIFTPIMKSDFGGTNYYKNPMLYGGGYDKYLGESVIHVINTAKKVTDMPTDRGVYSVKNATEKTGDKEVSNEVKLIVKLISESLGKTYYDVKEKDPSKRYKKIKFGDVCILLRSIGSGSRLAEELVSTLTALSVPVSSTVKKSIKDYPEIKVMVNLVSLLCCADRDVPLASVMINLFGFTENELKNIRKNYQLSKTDSFYTCVKNACNDNSGLGEKTSSFIKWLSDKRLIAEFLPADKLLSDIINETGYLAKITASPFGQLKAKRIERFIFESVAGGNQIKIREFENKLSDVLDDLTVSESAGDDTIKIMTMHASKGLEFPVVILGGTSKRFNGSDRFGNVISLRDYGVAVKSYFEENMTCCENAVRLYFKHKLKRDSAVEELRLFYVALTRAKCNLHVIVEGKDVDDKGIFYDRMSDFITVKNTPVFYYDEVDDLNEQLLFGTSVAGAPKTSDLTDKIVESLSYEYPYKSEIYAPVKTSVSSVNSKEEDEYFYTTKAFGESNREKGTDYHRFLELIDFYNYRGEEDAKEFVDKGLMSEDQIKNVDFDKISRILKLDIFAEMKGSKIYKERKFCAFVPYKEIAETESNQQVLIQGVIDLIAVNGDSAIIVDYKTSTIEKEKDLIKSYKKQIELYKTAVERNLKLKVKKCCFINLLQEKVITV